MNREELLEAGKRRLQAYKNRKQQNEEPKSTFASDPPIVKGLNFEQFDNLKINPNADQAIETRSRGSSGSANQETYKSPVKLNTKPAVNNEQVSPNKKDETNKDAAIASSKNVESGSPIKGDTVKQAFPSTSPIKQTVPDTANTSPIKKEPLKEFQGFSPVKQTGSPVQDARTINPFTSPTKSFNIPGTGNGKLRILEDHSSNSEDLLKKKDLEIAALKKELEEAKKLVEEKASKTTSELMEAESFYKETQKESLKLEQLKKEINEANKKLEDDKLKIGQSKSDLEKQIQQFEHNRKENENLLISERNALDLSRQDLLKEKQLFDQQKKQDAKKQDEKLIERVNQLEKDLNDKSLALKKRDSELEELQRSYESENHKAQDLNQELDNLKKSIADFEGELESKNAKLTKLAEEELTLKHHHEEAIRKLEEKHRAALDLEKFKATEDQLRVENEREGFKAEMEKIKNVHKVLLQENSTLKLETETLKNNEDLISKKNASLLQEIDSLQQQLDMHKQELSRKVQGFKEEADQLQSEIKRLTNENDELNAAKTEFIRKLESSKDSSQRESASLLIKVEELKGRIKEAEEEKENLREQMELTVEALKLDYNRKLEALKREQREEIILATEDQSADIDQLKLDLQMKVTEIERLESEIAGYKQELGKLKEVRIEEERKWTTELAIKDHDIQKLTQLLEAEKLLNVERLNRVEESEIKSHSLEKQLVALQNEIAHIDQTNQAKIESLYAENERKLALLTEEQERAINEIKAYYEDLLSREASENQKIVKLLDNQELEGELKLQVQRLQGELKFMKEELQKKEAALVSLNKEREGFIESKVRLEVLAHEGKDEITRLRTELTQAQERIGALDSNLVQLNESLSALNMECETLKKERDLLRTENDSLNNECIRLSNDIESIKSDNKANASLKVEHETVKANYERLKAEYEKLKMESEKFKTECEKLKVDFDKQKTELGRIKTEANRSKSDYESVKAELEKSKGQVLGLKTDLEKLKVFSQKQIESLSLNLKEFSSKVSYPYEMMERYVEDNLFVSNNERLQNLLTLLMSLDNRTPYHQILQESKRNENEKIVKERNDKIEIEEITNKFKAENDSLKLQISRTEESLKNLKEKNVASDREIEMLNDLLQKERQERQNFQKAKRSLLNIIKECKKDLVFVKSLVAIMRNQHTVKEIKEAIVSDKKKLEETLKERINSLERELLAQNDANTTMDVQMEGLLQQTDQTIDYFSNVIREKIIDETSEVSVLREALNSVLNARDQGADVLSNLHLEELRKVWQHELQANEGLRNLIAELNAKNEVLQSDIYKLCLIIKEYHLNCINSQTRIQKLESMYDTNVESINNKLQSLFKRIEETKAHDKNTEKVDKVDKADKNVEKADKNADKVDEDRNENVNRNANVQTLNTQPNSNENQDQIAIYKKRVKKDLEKIHLKYQEQATILITEIKYLKAKLMRESGFRADLMYQKKYIVMLLGGSRAW